MATVALILGSVYCVFCARFYLENSNVSLCSQITAVCWYWTRNKLTSIKKKRYCSLFCLLSRASNALSNRLFVACKQFRNKNRFWLLFGQFGFSWIQSSLITTHKNQCSTIGNLELFEYFAWTIMNVWLSRLVCTRLPKWKWLFLSWPNEFCNENYCLITTFWLLTRGGVQKKNCRHKFIHVVACVEEYWFPSS